MTEDKEKAQSVEDPHTDAEPTSNIEAQRKEALNPSDQNPAQAQQEAERSADIPQDPPEGFEPQSELQTGQAPGIEERPGEQVSDVEEEENDADEAPADQHDDEAVDEPESGTAE